MSAIHNTSQCTVCKLRRSHATTYSLTCKITFLSLPTIPTSLCDGICAISRLQLLTLAACIFAVPRYITVGGLPVALALGWWGGWHRTRALDAQAARTLQLEANARLHAKPNDPMVATEAGMLPMQATRAAEPDPQ